MFLRKAVKALCKLLTSMRAKAGRACDATLRPKHKLAEGSCTYKGTEVVFLISTKSSGDRRVKTVSRAVNRDDKQNKKTVHVKLVWYERGTKGRPCMSSAESKHNIQHNHSAEDAQGQVWSTTFTSPHVVDVVFTAKWAVGACIKRMAVNNYRQSVHLCSNIQGGNTSMLKDANG